MIKAISTQVSDSYELYLMDDAYTPHKRIGHVAIYTSGNISGLNVDTIYQHKGLGSRLLMKAEKIAKENYKLKQVTLRCYDHRLSFYYERGYVCQRTMPHDMNIMIKDLE